MILLFFLMALPFIFNEFYYIYNKKILDTSFNDKKRNISSLTKMELMYYFLRVLYWFWLIIGIFSTFGYLFLFLIVLKFLQFPFFHISRKLFIIWDNILPIISILLMLIILFLSFIK